MGSISSRDVIATKLIWPSLKSILRWSMDLTKLPALISFRTVGTPNGTVHRSPLPIWISQSMHICLATRRSNLMRATMMPNTMLYQLSNTKVPFPVWKQWIRESIRLGSSNGFPARNDSSTFPNVKYIFTRLAEPLLVQIVLIRWDFTELPSKNTFTISPKNSNDIYYSTGKTIVG